MKLRLPITSLFIFMLFVSTSAQTTWYVDQSATSGTEDGMSWTNAYLHLRDATNNVALQPGDSILVAQGTYYPDEYFTANTDNPAMTFNILDSVSILGAFPAGGGGYNSRSTSLYPTILSGDIQQDVIQSNNSHHVIVMSTNTYLFIDGVTITLGSATDGILSPLDRGGGLFVNDSSTLIISNCIITQNHAYNKGAGIYADESDLLISNCQFTQNQVTSSNGAGAGLHHETGDLDLMNCLFQTNSARRSGAAIHLGGVNANIQESQFISNRSPILGSANNLDGGAIFMIGSLANLYHCEFDLNRSENGGAIYSGSSVVQIDRCEFDRNEATDFGGAIYSTLFGGVVVPGIIDMTNSFFTRNECFLPTGEGTCLYMFNGDHYIRNNTFFLNNFRRRSTGHDIVGTVASGLKIDNNIFDRNLIGDLSSSGIVIGKNNHINYIGDGNFRALLQYSANVPRACMPTINAGSNEDVDSLELDFNGNPRISDGIVDLGAFENSNPNNPNVTTFYVRPSSIDRNGLGFNPNSPFINVQMALKNVCLDDGDEIRVAAGTYHPDYGPHTMIDDRHSSFILDTTITIRGGFNINFTTQDLLQNKSILSGAITNNPLENAYSVVTVNGSASGSTIDGLIISDGRADSITLLEQRTGAGIYNYSADLTVQNSIIKNNHAPGVGPNGTGAGYIHFGGTSNFINTVWANNSSSAQGGAVSSQGGNINLINNTFHNNHSELAGGAIHTFQGDVDILNSIFSNNTAPSRNDINQSNLGGSASASYSMFDMDVDTAVTDDGNNIVNAGITFYSPTFDDFRLTYCSDGIDQGLNSTNASLVDLYYNTRVIDTIDIGAAESQVPNDFSGNLYVSGSQNGQGVSWTNAMPDLNEAVLLANTCSIDSIFVATGTYHPSAITNDANHDREFKFYVDHNLFVQGGYSPDGTERNTGLYPTILSGNIQNDPIVSNNCFTVVEFGLGASGTTIDGFYIQDGYADSSVIVSKRTGAGLYDPGINLNLYNSVIRNNYAIGDSTDGTGAGILSFGGDNTYINNLWYNNHATVEGGAISVQFGTHHFINNTFTHNTTLSEGGAIHTFQGDVDVVNSVFYNNVANSILNINQPNLGGSSNVEYSLFDSDIDTFVIDDGNNIFNTTVNFIHPEAEDYRLTPCSPGVDQGDDLSNSTSLDLGGDTRKIGTIDMGAYESEFINAPISSLFVDPNLAGNGSSWSSPLSNLQVALKYSNSCQVDTVFVAEGVYFPNDGPSTTGYDSLARFVVDSTTVIKGSYPSGGGVPSLSAHASILSGEIGNTNTIEDNTKTILELNQYGTIDGFIIEKGNARGLGDPGGAGRDGGGIFTDAGGHFKNIVFRNNSAVIGGGINAVGQKITMENCLFHDNHAYAYGGAIGIDFTPTTDSSELINLTIVNNTENDTIFGFGGSAIAMVGAHAKLKNSIINDHSGAFRILSGNLFMEHSMLDTFVSAGVIDLSNNLLITHADFIQPELDFYALTPCSPGVDDGLNSFSLSSDDLLENNRINGVIDMGALECEFLDAPFTNIYVDQSASGNGTSWPDAMPDLNLAIKYANSCGADTILVAEGTYTPSDLSAPITHEREARFYLDNEYYLKGGYSAGGSTHNLNEHPSILNGDIQKDDILTNNVFTVIETSLTLNKTTIDGFIIEGGYADSIGNSQKNTGAGHLQSTY